MPRVKPWDACASDVRHTRATTTHTSLAVYTKPHAIQNLSRKIINIHAFSNLSIPNTETHLPTGTTKIRTGPITPPPPSPRKCSSHSPIPNTYLPSSSPGSPCCPKRPPLLLFSTPTHQTAAASITSYHLHRTNTAGEHRRVSSGRDTQCTKQHTPAAGRHPA